MPELPAAATSVSVDDALAPGDSDEIERGENTPDHPDGTSAPRLKDDAAQPELSLFVTVTW